MIKIRSKMLVIIIVTCVSLLNSFVIFPFANEKLSAVKWEFLKSDIFVTILCGLLAIYLIPVTIKRVKQLPKDDLILEVKQNNLYLMLGFIMLLLSLVLFVLSVLFKSMAVFMIGLCCLILVLNVLITHKWLSGVNDHQLFYSGTNYDLDKIEVFEFGRDAVNIRISKNYWHLNIYELLRIPIENEHHETFEKIMLNYKAIKVER